MSALIDHIKELNAKAKAWQDEVPGRIAGMLLEDEKWWNETRDVYTVEDFKRWDIESTLSDLAKDAYGTSSACPNTDGMTLAELEETQDQLLKAAEDSYLEEQAMQKESIKRFEASILEVIEIGAGDRETAIRWLRGNEEADRGHLDDNYFEYCNNLPYGYLKGEVRPELA